MGPATPLMILDGVIIINMFSSSHGECCSRGISLHRIQQLTINAMNGCCKYDTMSGSVRRKETVEIIVNYLIIIKYINSELSRD
jgi:hypothetical protein